jgi:hypothetical protein
MRLAYPGRYHYINWEYYEWSSIGGSALSQTPVDGIDDGLAPTLRSAKYDGGWYPLRDVDGWYAGSKLTGEIFSS